jgi:CelD/BcsL family acetyltransferase involved in cellulose biosynthesis
VISSGPLQSRTVRGAADLQALVPEWRDLEDRAQRVPLSVEVLRASGGLSTHPDVRVVTVSDETGLHAVWPLAVDHRGPVRIARRLGGPLQATDGLTLSRAAPTRRVARAAWAEVARWTDVDVLQLNALTVGDPLLEQPGLCHWSQSTLRTCRVRLHPGRDLLATKSKQRRKAVRRRRRQLEAQGEVRFRRLTAPADREIAVMEAIQAKRQWLDAQGAPAPVLRSSRFQDGLRAAARLAPEDARFEVFRLELDGRGVAWELGHVDGDTFRSFVGAYDGELARLGLGVTLTLETVAWCAARGLRLYDFLPPVTPFKQSWADHERRICRVVCPLRTRGRLVVPAVRDGRQLAKQAWQRLVPPDVAKALLVG